MRILRRFRQKSAPVLKSAPTRIKLVDESETLAKKYADKVAWMREKGIQSSIFEEKKEPLRADESQVEEIKRKTKSR